MTVKLNRFATSNLRNSEYTIFINQFAQIVVKYQPETLHLAKSFQKVNAMLPAIAKIKAQETSSALSNQLHDLDNERDTLFNAIVAQAKTMSKLNLPTIKPHTEVLNSFLDKHGRDIATASLNAETKRLADLLNDYEATPTVKTAIAGLNLKLLFDQLLIANNNFAALFLQRTEEDAATEKVDARAIRIETDKILTAFLNAIEYCSAEYDDKDYSPLANELNDLIGYYKTQLKARNTRRSNGKDVSVEPEIVKES